MSQDLQAYTVLNSQGQSSVPFTPYASKSDMAEIAAMRGLGVSTEEILGLGDEIYDDAEHEAIRRLGGVVP